MTDKNFQVYSAAITDRGLSEKRPQNEDSFLDMSNLGLFAVADGVGGAQAGDVASQMAVEILGEAFVHQQVGSDAEEVMRIAVERANSAIFQMSTDLPQLSMMATTIVALHLKGNIATIGHVGDSRLYRLDEKGNLFRETQDHSVVEEEVRAGRMTAAQAANHPSRNVISRALGAEPAVEVDMKTIMIEPNTTFLLCSDGITRHISDLEIRDLLASGGSLAEICARMKSICYERGAEDNLTAVIVKVAAADADALNGSARTPEYDLDEATVATARPAAAGMSDSVYFDEDRPTQNLQMPADAPPAAGSAEDLNAEEPNAPASIEQPQTVSAAAGGETAPRQAQNDEPVFVPTGYQIEEKKGGGFWSGVFSSLLLLLIGAGLGAGALYYFGPVKTVEIPAQIEPEQLEPQTTDISFSTYENNRRNVDKDPGTYLATFGNTPPADAADYYLLARAHLLMKNYDEARKNLLEARNRLAEADESNRAVLATDIAAALAVLRNPYATRDLEKELASIGSGAANNQANTNSAANANAPGVNGAADNSAANAANTNIGRSF